MIQILFLPFMCCLGTHIISLIIRDIISYSPCNIAMKMLAEHCQAHCSCIWWYAGVQVYYKSNQTH